VISDDVVWTEESVELDRVETIRAGVGSHAVDDEVDIFVKLFDLRVMTILATIFHGQRMEVEDVEQYTFIRGVGLLHVDPDHSRLVFQQLGQVFFSRAFDNLRRTGSINENLHANLLSHKKAQKAQNFTSESVVFLICAFCAFCG